MSIREPFLMGTVLKFCTAGYLLEKSFFRKTIPTVNMSLPTSIEFQA
jgi:hypothetical protein